MKLKPVTKKIEREIKKALDKVSERDTAKLVRMLLPAERVFLTGQGRSGLVAEAFAMRLVQLGMESHFVGEATSPGIGKKDLLVAVSGSGKTVVTKSIVLQARKAKAKVALITSDKRTEMAKKAELAVGIRARTKKGGKSSSEPMGSLFEQAALLYLDSVIILLMEKLGKKEKELRERHSNLE